MVSVRSEDALGLIGGAREGVGKRKGIMRLGLRQRLCRVGEKGGKKWGHRGSNAGPLELQSTALPTELCPRWNAVLACHQAIEAVWGFRRPSAERSQRTRRC